MVDLTTIRQTQDVVRPVRVALTKGAVRGAERLLEEKSLAPTFQETSLTMMQNGATGEYAAVVLDFGREIVGSARLIVCDGQGACRVRLTFGESLSEALSAVGEHGAMNNHSARDFEIFLPLMSDVEYGMSGFRFLKVELLSPDMTLGLKCAVGVFKAQEVERKGYLATDDARLNDILETAIYTCRLCLQRGTIWDGIKRDRLVWSGDLNPEILTAAYAFGPLPNAKNSLSLLREPIPLPLWINDIPSYSAWWVINLADDYLLGGDAEYFRAGLPYARGILELFDACTDPDGATDFARMGAQPTELTYYLDWPTYGTPDAAVGTEILILRAAQKLAALGGEEEKKLAARLGKKLGGALSAETAFKQTRAAQILAGRRVAGDAEFLAAGGGKGFSTFMAYYILKALDAAGGKNPIAIAKEYYGGMLDLGATTFWEDFDLDWTKNAARIDEIAKDGKTDVHRDYGKFCYQGFRHSLCHGWSSGVAAFAFEHLLGLEILEPGMKRVRIRPRLDEVGEIEAVLPTPRGALSVKADRKRTEIEAPRGVAVERD